MFIWNDFKLDDLHWNHLKGRNWTFNYFSVTSSFLSFFSKLIIEIVYSLLKAINGILSIQHFRIHSHTFSWLFQLFLIRFTIYSNHLSITFYYLNSSSSLFLSFVPSLTFSYFSLLLACLQVPLGNYRSSPWGTSTPSWQSLHYNYCKRFLFNWFFNCCPTLEMTFQVLSFFVLQWTAQLLSFNREATFHTFQYPPWTLFHKRKM